LSSAYFRYFEKMLSLRDKAATVKEQAEAQTFETAAGLWGASYLVTIRNSSPEIAAQRGIAVLYWNNGRAFCFWFYSC